MTHFKKKHLVLAIAASLSVTGTAFAADGDQPSDENVVIVTGNKIDRAEEDTLASVEVVTEEEIKDHADKTLSDIIIRTPGLYTQSDNEDWGIRGIPVTGFNDQGPAASSGAISVFVDDAVQMQSLLTSNPLGLWDTQQVEVHSGSQSTTQGRNSLAGSVVIKTNDPTYDTEFAAQTNIGNYGTKGASVLANGALIDGKVAGRIAIDSQSSDGYIDNTARSNDPNAKEALNARGKLLIQPSEDLDILLTLAHVNNKAGTNAVNQTNGVPSYYQLSQDTDTFSDVKQDSLTAKIDYYINEEFSITSITSGTKAELDVLLDFDRTATSTETVLRDHEQKNLNQELRLNYETDELDGFLGLYYSKYDGEFIDNSTLAALGFATLVTDGNVDIENQAIFAEANWRFAPKWQFTAGFRFDHEENHTVIDYSLPVPNLVAVDTNTSEDVFLPKLGLSYDITDKQTVGIVWKKGYRSGGVNLRAATSVQAYEAEFTTTTELSWRGKWLDDRLTTKANIYHTDWEDQQVSINQGGGFFSISNAAESTLQGIEFGAEFAATPELTLFASAAFNDSEYESFIDNTSGNNYAGQDFLFSPEFTASVGASYQATAQWQIGTDVVYIDDSVSSYEFTGGQVTGEQRNDDVTLVNLNSVYQINDNFQVSGYVKNLFDEEYISNNQSSNVLDVGAPLTFGMAVRYDY